MRSLRDIASFGHGPVHFLVIWLRRDERLHDTWRTDPTRPFGFRSGSRVSVGIGGHWGCVEVEVWRPGWRSRRPVVPLANGGTVDLSKSRRLW